MCVGDRDGELGRRLRNNKRTGKDLVGNDELDVLAAEASDAFAEIEDLGGTANRDAAGYGDVLIRCVLKGVELGAECAFDCNAGDSNECNRAACVEGESCFGEQQCKFAVGDFEADACIGLYCDPHAGGGNEQFGNVVVVAQKAIGTSD